MFLLLLLRLLLPLCAHLALFAPVALRQKAAAVYLRVQVCERVCAVGQRSEQSSLACPRSVCPTQAHACHASCPMGASYFYTSAQLSSAQVDGNHLLPS